jgi:DNA-3-methyladenine glycosylase II
MPAPTRTSIMPPKLVSLPAERAQLEFSSRSLVYSEDGDRLLRVWGSPERPWVVAVEPGRTRWRIEAWGADGPAARAAVRELFSLDDPLEEFYRLARSEPVLASAARRFRGLRLPRDAHIYESLFHAVVGQQLSVRAANAIKRRIMAEFAEPCVVDGIEVPCVPRPSRLARASPVALRRTGLSRTKVRALQEIARSASLLPTGEALRAGSLDDACLQLEGLHGVGRWTAENVVLRGAGRRDVFVAGDLGVRVALDRYRAVPRNAPEATARAWAEQAYPGWGSYATLYLWRRLVTEASPAG